MAPILVAARRKPSGRHEVERRDTGRLAPLRYFVERYLPRMAAMFVFGMAWCLTCSAPADDVVVRTERTLKIPRSRDPVLGGAREKVFFQVWIPDGAKTIRGVMCNPFSKDDAVSRHWQAACRRWQFAYLQTDFDAVKKDEFSLLPKALVELAKTSGHAELAQAPFCWTGMSRGGGMSMQLSELLPDRTIAAVPVCLEVGPTSDATRQIPVTTIFGEKDGSQMKLLLEKLPVERRQEARWAVAVQWNRKHEFALANNLSFVFLDDVIARRLPSDEASRSLRAIPLEAGWLGDVGAWNKDGRRAAIAPWSEFKGDRGAACWFPSERVAAVWQAFVSATKEITIHEPPGLGDGQPFLLHSANKPVSVKLTLAPALQPTKVELWDAERRLAELTTAPWHFDVTLTAGFHSLFAVVHDAQAARKTSRPHTIVVE